MADKPSRALVLYGDGLARFIDPSHTHLHSLASIASCGFLSLPNSTPSESVDERIVREFAVLLDANETYLNSMVSIPCLSRDTSNAECEIAEQTLSTRFMGIKAAIFTSNLSLKLFAAKLGLSVFQLDDLVKICDPISESEVKNVVPKLFSLLGFQEGKALETNQFDLVFLHFGVGERENSKECSVIAPVLEYVNALVGGLMISAQPESEISSRLHLSLVMSYGNVSGDDDVQFSVSKTINENDTHLKMLFPRQSYTMKGEIPRRDIRHHFPMLIAQWQNAVTRKDMVEKFSFEDIKEHGGNLTIPADRFLHEVAFKLWKAPKYGA